MIGIGQSAQGATTGNPTIVTSAVNTALTGSTFIAVVDYAGTTGVIYTISDTVGGVPTGNTYTQIGTDTYDGSGRTVLRFQCVNGIGGNTHVVTATANNPNTPAGIIILAELTGALTTTPLDQSNTNIVTFGSPPVSSGSLTLGSVPAGNEMLLSYFSSAKFVATLTFAESNGFTILQSQAVGNSGSTAGALGYLLVSANGTYSASWTDGQTGTAYVATIDAFFGAGGAAAKVPYMNYSFQPMVAM